MGINKCQKGVLVAAVANAMNAAASEGWTDMVDMKKKWSNLRVDAKKCKAPHKSICATGREKETLELTLLDEKLARIEVEK